MSATMQAIYHIKYGLDTLELKEVEKPLPKKNEVLIKIHAVAVNDFDWVMLIGKPLIYRLFMGLFKPRIKIAGHDVAGIVEAIGNEVTHLKVGDEVYGDLSDSGFGGFAQYTCAKESSLVIKPPTMTWEQAAATAHASTLALQGLVDKGDIREGQKILINGAGGGVGTFGIQIAKQYNAEVTGVDSAIKLDMMLSLGYDHVIDYKKEDFTRNGIAYDLILDTRTTRSPFAFPRSLKPNGIYVTVGGTIGRLLQTLLLKGLIRVIYKKNIRILGLKNNKDLAHVNELFEAGKLQYVIDGPFKFSETQQAIQYFGEAKHKGKVVITVDHN